MTNRMSMKTQVELNLWRETAKKLRSILEKKVNVDHDNLIEIVKTYVMLGDKVYQEDALEEKERFALEVEFGPDPDAPWAFLRVATRYRVEDVWNNGLVQLRLFAEPFHEEVIDLCADMIYPLNEELFEEELLVLASIYIAGENIPVGILDEFSSLHNIPRALSMMFLNSGDLTGNLVRVAILNGDITREDVLSVYPETPEYILTYVEVREIRKDPQIHEKEVAVAEHIGSKFGKEHAEKIFEDTDNPVFDEADCLDDAEQLWGYNFEELLIPNRRDIFRAYEIKFLEAAKIRFDEINANLN
jgi:hypothetical protein